MKNKILYIKKTHLNKITQITNNTYSKINFNNQNILNILSDELEIIDYLLKNIQT